MRFSYNHLITEIVSNFNDNSFYISYSDMQWSMADFFFIDAENLVPQAIEINLEEEKLLPDGIVWFRKPG